MHHGVLHSFPTRRSSDLDSEGLALMGVLSASFSPDGTRIVTGGGVNGTGEALVWDARTGTAMLELKGHTHLVMSVAFRDRKSTRLNSSHTVISYAVFCLK